MDNKKQQNNTESSGNTTNTSAPEQKKSENQSSQGSQGSDLGMPSSKNKEGASGEPTNETGEKKQVSWQIALTIVAIIAIILIFALPSNKDRDLDMVTDNDTEQTEDNMQSEEEDANETDEVPGAEVIPGTGNAVQNMTPVSVGDEFVYRFDGIDWFFEPVDGGTAVKFKFSEFSRREGSIVAFGNPYRLGVFPGECSATQRLTYNTAVNADNPIAFVTCRSDAENGTDIAIFQNGPEVYASQRTVADNATGDFSEFFSRDITTIVR